MIPEQRSCLRCYKPEWVQKDLVTPQGKVFTAGDKNAEIYNYDEATPVFGAGASRLMWEKYGKEVTFCRECIIEVCHKPKKKKKEAVK